MIKSKY